MKKTLLLAAMSALSLTSIADDSASDIIFKFKDGTEQSIGAKNLEMNINEGSFKADNGTVVLEIPLSSLQQFCFGSSAATITSACDLSEWYLYDLDGKCAGVFPDISSCSHELPAGVYIAKSTTATIKIAIK